jgi:hypothetical protein
VDAALRGTVAATGKPVEVRGCDFFYHYLGTFEAC